jgi:hypothetical protein
MYRRQSKKIHVGCAANMCLSELWGRFLSYSPHPTVHHVLYCRIAYTRFAVYIYLDMRSTQVWMRSSRVVRESDCQCRNRNSPAGSILASSDTLESEWRQIKQC